MRRVDTSGWREFRFGDLFKLATVKQAKSQQMIPTVDASDGIPYVVQSRYGNMVSRYVDKQWLIDHDEPVVEGGTLCLGVTLNAVSYQPNEFGASQIITARNEHLNELTGLFMTSILDVCTQVFTYQEKPGLKKYQQMMVTLPTTPSGEPDWDYMESYMARVIAGAADEIKALSEIDVPHTHADTSTWQRFRIGDLFNIIKGTRLTRADMVPGDTPFIGATRENNGITAHIGNEGHVHPGNVMTVAYNGQKATGTAFWQPIDFWASDDVNVLYPKFQLTREIALFLAPIFWEVGRPYAFDDKWRREAMLEDELPLPATAAGEPDWAAMQSYMESQYDAAERHFDALTLTVGTQAQFG